MTEFLKGQRVAREPQAMGLAQSDTIVRHPMAQKLELLLRDTSRSAEPKEADLRRCYEAHPEYFQTDASVSFTQIFFGHGRRKGAATGTRATLGLVHVPQQPVETVIAWSIVSVAAEIVSDRSRRRDAAGRLPFQPGRFILG